MSVQLFTRSPLRAVAIALVLAGVSGCEPKPPEPLVAGITGYNFTSEGVQAYSVNGQRGSNLPPFGGGGSLACCVSFPVQWSHDLTVTVDWTMGHYTEPWEKRRSMTLAEETKCCWTERTLRKTVPVERYGKEGGRLQVFFLPSDTVKVYVTKYDLGHEKHPSGMPYPENPQTIK